MISQLYLTFTRLLILLSLLSIALMFPVSSIYLDEISKFVPSIRFDYNSYYFQDAYGKRYDYATMREAKKQVSDLLAEERVDGKPWSVRRDLQQMQEQMRVREFNQHQPRKKSKGWER